MSDDPPKPIQPVPFLAMHGPAAEPDDAERDALTAYLCPQFDWLDVLANLNLPPSVKHVGTRLALYANTDGTSAFPGIGNLVRQTGHERKVVWRALCYLRRARLILLVAPGRYGPRRHADEYWLIHPPTVTDRVAYLPARADPSRP